MSASRLERGADIEASLPGSLRQHPALRRLRASLQAQCPAREAVNAVSARLLSPDSDAAASAEIRPGRAEILKS